MTPVRTAARAMMAALFVSSGARTLSNPDPLVPAASRVTERVAPHIQRIDKRLPTDARTLVQANAATQLVAGLLLVSRWHRAAAVMLAGSIVPTTLAGHRFWEEDDSGRRGQHQAHFLKNLAVLGGLVLAATDTDGRPSLSWRTGRAMHDMNRSVHRNARQVRRLRKVSALARRLPG